MKVVLFCGGLGMRMREYSESVPKPMVDIGYRPILWHVMKYYAHFGHKEFILCLGWKANVIKEYFLNYQESLSNDFIISGGGKEIELLGSDIEDWKITFCDTGINASIGERLKAVEQHVKDEPTFLANYTDGLSDIMLPDLVNFHHCKNSIATFVSVRPSQSFHTVGIDESGAVNQIREVRNGDVWMNGGFFVFSNEIFKHLGTGQDMVDGAFVELIKLRRCFSMKYDGFWGCMDTYKELQELQDLHDRGATPWTVWQSFSPNGQSSTNHLQHHWLEERNTIEVSKAESNDASA